MVEGRLRSPLFHFMPTKPHIKAAIELLSSMRFAVSLLTVLAIASIIGTVVSQNQPFNNYLNQFGPFWFPIFESLGLYSVYNAGWFLLILVFLLLSTSLCLVRQGPQMVREMKSFRTHAREASLQQFTHRAQWQTALPTETLVARATDALGAAGFKSRTDVRPESVLVAAKAGSGNRLGYFLAHGGIVVILIGGLLDGNVPLRIKLALEGKAPTTLAALEKNIPPGARLDENTPSFRANLFVPEGKTSSLATINLDDGVLVQDLPFDLELKKFTIEHYSTGAPKLFASDVVVTDKKTGQSSAHRIEVNRPLKIAGLMVYQSSFEDGGSQLDFRQFDLRSNAITNLSATVGENYKLADGKTTLEVTGFRAFNIENMNEDEAAGSKARLGSAITPADKKDLRNVGPSVQFKLRDEAGQAREFDHYMLPIQREGRDFMLAGMRASPNEPFRYLRLPVDENGRIETFFSWRTKMLDAAARGELARRFASHALKNAAVKNGVGVRLEETAERTLALFADKGFETVGRFLEQGVPAAERDKAADIFLKMLEGLGWEALQEVTGAPLELTPARAQYVRDALAAASDAFHFGAPVYLQLTGFTEVRASVFQVTRSPGQPLVFFGALLLTLGVACMLYIRERRAFVLAKHDGSVLLAMATNRKTLDFENEFARVRDQLQSTTRA